MEFQCLNSPSSSSVSTSNMPTITISDQASQANTSININIINDANVLSFPINLDDNLLHLPPATPGAGGQQIDLGDVILADDCFLGSVVDIVNEDDEGNVDEDEDELVVGKMTADDEDQDDEADQKGAQEEEEVNLDDEDQESTTSSVDLRLLDNSYSFSEDEDVTGGKELEAVAEEVKDDGKKRKNHNNLMPTFRIKFRTKKEKAESQDDKGACNNRDPITGKRPVGRPRKHPPKGKTALYLSDLPQAPNKSKRGPGTGRRGPRGPYKKRAKLGYAANPVIKEKNHYKKDDDEEDEDDVGRLTICDGGNRSNNRVPGRRGDRSKMKQREKERRDKLALWIEVLRKMVPGVFDKTERTCVLELAAQYVLFLKHKGGMASPESSADFLANKDKVAQEFYDYKMGMLAKEKEEEERRKEVEEVVAMACST